mmetsp:Transcript_30204/g.95278  ORF Transcript_30204/g.95278 Transcript_30204/m.95278 type:complete len:482 (+) Transcript_30204:124-1569(+)
MILERRLLLLDRHRRVRINRIHALQEVCVIDIIVVAQVAVLGAEQTNLPLVQLETKHPEDPDEPAPRDVASVDPIHVLEHGLHEDATLDDAGPDLLLHGLDALCPVRGHRDPVPPARSGAHGIGHGGHRQRVGLQAGHSEALVDVRAEVLVAKEAIVPHICCRDGVKLKPVDLLRQVHHSENRLGLAHSADALSQGIKVLEVLVEPQALLHDLGLQLLHWVQALVGPFRLIGPQVEVAPGEGRRLVLHGLHDVVVQRHEVNVPHRGALRAAHAVVLGQHVELPLGELLFEGEVADELVLRDLPASPRVHSGRRGSRRAVEVREAVLQHYATGLAEHGHLVEQVHEPLLVGNRVALGFLQARAQHGTAGRGRHPVRRGVTCVEDLIYRLAELGVVHVLGLLHATAHLGKMVSEELHLLLGQAQPCRVQGPRELGQHAAARPQGIKVDKEVLQPDAALKDKGLHLADDIVDGDFLHGHNSKRK